MQQNEEKYCATLETFTNEQSSVTVNEEVVSICAEIQKNTRIPGCSRTQIHKIRVNKYYSTTLQHVELTTFNEVNMTPQ